jgi:hypothetical protein
MEIGNLTRIGPNDLVTDDPEIIRRISAVRSPYTRSDWYNATAFSHKINHVFCERNEERHIDLRNKLVPGVSGLIVFSEVYYLGLHEVPLLKYPRLYFSIPVKKTTTSSKRSTTNWSASFGSFKIDIRRLPAISAQLTLLACANSSRLT